MLKMNNLVPFFISKIMFINHSYEVNNTIMWIYTIQSDLTTNLGYNNL